MNRRRAVSAGTLRQGFVFACVGGLATAVHVGAALAARHGLGLAPLQANLLGYILAVGVSYLGNASLTFGAAAWRAGQMSRFLATSLAGLGLGQALMWLLVSRLALPFWIGLAAVVTTVPALTFLSSRHWVFRRT